MINQELNRKNLSREVEGLGPMKPGNQHICTVPIPTEGILRDELF